MFKMINLKTQLITILGLFFLGSVASAKVSPLDVECTLSKLTTNQLGEVIQTATTSKSFNLGTMSHEILLTLTSDPYFLQIFRPSGLRLVMDFGRAEEEGLSHRTVASVSGANEVLIERYVDVEQGIFYRGNCRLINQPLSEGELALREMSCNTSAHATEGENIIHKEAKWNSQMMIAPFGKFEIKGNRSRSRSANLEFIHGSNVFSSIYLKGVSDHFGIYIEQWPVEFGHRLIQASCH